VAKKILIIDDDPNMLKMVGLTLKQAGYEIVVAQDAQSASLKLIEVSPDLIILDIMLPGVSGMDFLQALRADPRGRRIPVILLSALSDVDDKVAGFKAGADEYLTKPIDGRELLARVTGLLERTEALQADQKTTHAKVIAMMGVKGGVGTTTVMVNLAGTVAEQGHSVLVAELHPSAGTLSRTMGQNRGGHLGDLLARNADRVNPKMLDQVLFKHPNNIHLLAYPEQLELELEITESFIESLFEASSTKVEMIIVDLPPKLDAISRYVLQECDVVILVLEPSQIFLDAASVLMHQVQEIAKQAGKFGVIIVNRSGLASSSSKDEIAKLLGIQIFGTVPQAGDLVANAYRRGHLLITEQPDHMAAEAIRRIAAEAILSD